MYIHIGGDVMVRLKDVIGIFDVHPNTGFESLTSSDSARKNSGAVVIEIGDIKSCIVTTNKVYYSPISSLTLKKRAQYIEFAIKDSD